MAKTRAELEQENRELRQAMNGGGPGGLSDLLSLGFWTTIIAGFAGFIAYHAMGQEKFGETFGIKGMGMVNMISGLFGDPVYDSAAMAVEFEKLDRDAAADLVENAINGAEGVTLGRRGIEALVGAENSPARQSLVKLLGEVEFDFTDPSFDEAKLRKMITTAITDEAYHPYMRGVLDASIVDIQNGGEQSARSWRQMLGLGGASNNAASIFSDPLIMAALLKSPELVHTSVSLIGALTEDETIRSILEGNEDLISQALTEMSAENAIALIDALKSGSLDNILTKPGFAPARNALFEIILKDNAIEESLTVERLKTMGLVGNLSEDNAQLLVTFFQASSDLGNGQTNMDVLAKLGQEDHETLEATVAIIQHMMNPGSMAGEAPSINAQQKDRILAALKAMDFDWFSEDNINALTSRAGSGDNLVQIDQELIDDLILEAGFGTPVAQGKEELYDLAVVNGIAEPTLKSMVR